MYGIANKRSIEYRTLIDMNYQRFAYTLEASLETLISSEGIEGNEIDDR